MGKINQKKLIIIGAGSVGGFIAYNHEHLKENYRLIGFLDDDPQKQGVNLFNYPVLGGLEKIVDYLDCVFIIGIAFPRVKETICNKLEKYKLDFINYISPYAWISKEVTIGKGVIIYPGACINYESEIGDFVTVNMNAVVGHNCRLKRYVTLAPNVSLAGHTLCKEGADLGIGSSTRQNVIIGSFTVLGGQAMLLNNTDKNELWLGVPARKKE